jgi:hypothetical protein
MSSEQGCPCRRCSPCQSLRISFHVSHSASETLYKI